MTRAKTRASAREHRGPERGRSSVVELIVVGATLALAAGLSGVEGWRRVAGARALDRFAKWRGHHFAPPTPEMGTRSARTFGTRAGLAFAIDFCRVSREPHTRVAVESAAGRIARITLVGASRRGGAYIVHGLDPADAELLISSCSKALARLDERRGVRLSSDGARVTVLWRGVETDPLVLDSALELAIAAARFERPDAPYR